MCNYGKKPMQQWDIYQKTEDTNIKSAVEVKMTDE